MKTYNRTLFHISRENKWKIGDVIISGEHENQFWIQCKNYSPQVSVNGEVFSLFNMFDQFSTFDVTKNNIDFLYNQLKNVSKETAFYIREQVFEEIRKENYSRLPSRQKCIWLSDEEQLSYWKSAVINEKRCVLTLELNGEIFCGDASWLTVDTFSSTEYANRAEHYWSGELSLIPKIEYLFYGQAVVKEIVSLS